jgi:hypothetical protein
MGFGNLKISGFWKFGDYWVLDYLEMNGFWII